MMRFLGSIFKSLIEPVSSWIAGIFYKALILMPLEILNYIYASFLFLTGQGVSKLLFNTSITGSKLHFDLFKNPSPITKYYIMMFAIAGGLGVLFLSLSIVKSITSTKRQSQGLAANTGIAASARLAGGTFLITIIPIIVIGFLSLVSAAATLFTGARSVPPNPADIASIRQYLVKDVDDVLAFDGNTKYNDQATDIYIPKYDYETNGGQIHYEKTTISNLPSEEFVVNAAGANSAVQFDGFKPKDLFSSTTTVSSNYEYINSLFEDLTQAFNDDKNIGITNQAIKEDTKALKDSFHDLFTNDILTTDTSGIKLKDEIKDKLLNLKQQLNSASPDKNLSIATALERDNSSILDVVYKISDVIDATQVYLDKYANYYTDEMITKLVKRTGIKGTQTHPLLPSKAIDISESATPGYQNELLTKLRLMTLMKNVEMGIKPLIDSQYISTGNGVLNPPTVSTLGDMMAKLNVIINGDGLHKLSSSLDLSSSSLAQILSPFDTASITVVMYHMATGNSDSNWKQVPHHPKGSRIFISMIAIGAAIVIMTQLAMFAAKRIFDIGILFVISPIFVVWSTADEGKKLRQWLDLMIAKVLSIIAIFIAIRVLDVVVGSFERALRTNSSNLWADIDSYGIHNTSSESMFATVLLALMTIGGLHSVKMGAHMISTLFGAGAGLESIGNLLSGSKLAFSKGARMFRGGAVATTRGGATAMGMRGTDATGAKTYGTRSMRAAGLKKVEKVGAVKGQVTGGRVEGRSGGYKKLLDYKAANKQTKLNYNAHRAVKSNSPVMRQAHQASVNNRSKIVARLAKKQAQAFDPKNFKK